MRTMSAVVVSLLLLVSACTQVKTATVQSPKSETMRLEAEPEMADMPGIDQRLRKYTSFELAADLEGLSSRQKQMIPLLIEAAEAMDEAFWLQAYGDRDELMASLDDDNVKRFAEINYGPWDRLDSNQPFVPGVGAKPKGANFYPTDMTISEFEKAVEENAALGDPYTMVQRTPSGDLKAVPYSEAFGELYRKAAGKLLEAADLAEDAGFEKYLRLRAKALLSDEYYESDLAWMDMKTNAIDIVIGPIENYEDALFNYKTANEAYVLIKDLAWSKNLQKYAAMLPALQTGLPVDDVYKQEKPGTDSDLNAYDVVFYAGDCNAGSKTIAINLPNDERVQLKKGSRRLQLKNAMRAKFDRILIPIADTLIAPDQRSLVSFEAFFENTMFHEVAHGLGIKKTITDGGTVRSALKNHASALEEGKADVLGLYMLTSLHQQGELDDGKIEDNYVTFMASIFRSIRFGASSAHGVANLIRFNFFSELGVFSRDSKSGVYHVDIAKIGKATNTLSAAILKLQGDGDYDAVGAFVARYGTLDATLKADLERLSAAGIPVDVVFDQGVEVLGL